ncbi:hypothetical protein IW261DRAFT_1424839 [Armillaria novae-zelandiae]|uniref:Uncharacterized protein n=1 Tax=Armillaria novae-zelandiae TaxID=153914 RepID=A0AA39NTT7_9AGAR|nr:hypothetical protein IW261DRAFT_1424839 [Armillaria novae-zelandiae]
MSTTQLFPAFDTPLANICYNLAQVRNVTAQYLEITTRNAAPMGELIRVVTATHVYLDAHIDVLRDFKFTGSLYRLALCSQIHVIASCIPVDLRHPLWKKWYLTSEEALRNEVHYSLFLFISSLTRRFYPKRPQAPPHHGATRLKPRMIHTPEPPKELSFSAPGKKLIGVILPPAGSALGGPSTHKHQREQESITNAPVPVSDVRSEPMAGTSVSSKPKAATGHGPAKTRTYSSSDSDVPPMSNKGEGPVPTKEPLFFPSHNDSISDALHSPPSKHTRLSLPVHEESSPPPHAYHPLTGVPLFFLRPLNFSAPLEPAPPLPPSTGPSSKALGKQRAVAPSSPPHQSPEAGPSNSTSDTVHMVNNTFYACAFHPALDLQFHEPPSCEALEHLKLSVLPVAPKSLSKPPKQVRKGREYIYQAHSDANPYFIWPPLLSWPCFNCTLTRSADECVFKGNVAIAQGLAHIDTINTQLKSLGKVVNSLRADREGVLSELANGLDSIASHEHGSEIINAYTWSRIF